MRWTELLEALDIPVSDASLPMTLKCPLCGFGHAAVYQDHVFNDQWYHCTACQFSGPLPRLAATLWDVDDTEAIRRLEHHTERKLQIEQYTYRTDFCGVLQNLWKTSRETASCKHPLLRKLSEALHLPRADMSQARWEDGPGQLIGIAKAREVSDAFSGRRLGKSSKSKLLIFKGRCWEDVLLLPSFGPPGRPAMFEFYGREGRIPEDYVCRPIRDYLGLWQHTAGLYGIELAQQVARPGDPVFAVDSSLDVLGIQLQHFHSSAAPLPLVSWFDSRQFRNHPFRTLPESWQPLTRNKIIFWAGKLTGALLQQAVETKGRIFFRVTHGNRVRSLRDVLDKDNRSPEDMLVSVEKWARPWPEAVAIAFEKMPEIDLQEVLRDCADRGIDLSPAWEAVRPSQKSRLEAIRADAPAARQKTTAYGSVIEKDGCWFKVRKLGLKLVSDAILRLDELLVTPDRRDLRYRGRVLYQGETIEFVEDKLVIDKGPQKWIENLLIGQRRGLLQYKQIPGKDFIDLALSFQRCRTAVLVARSGWNTPHGGFTFPNFSLIEGEIRRNLPMAIRKNTPGQQLQAPTEPLKIPKMDSRSGKLFWAFAALELATLVAPGRLPGLPESGRTFRRRSIGCVGQAASHWGACLHEYLTGLPLQQRGNFMDPFSELAAEHGFALGVNVGGRRKPWLHRVDDQCCFLVPNIDPYTAMVLQAQTGWNFVYCQTAPNPTAELGEFLRKLVPAYLLHWQQDKPDFHIHRDNWELTLLDDLDQWLESLGHDLPQVQGARELLCMEKRHGDGRVVTEFLAEASIYNKLPILRDGFGGSAFSLLDGEKGLLVPFGALEELVGGKSRVFLNARSLGPALRHSGRDGWLLIEERKDAWVVNADAWRTARRRLAADRTSFGRFVDSTPTS